MLPRSSLLVILLLLLPATGYAQCEKQRPALQPLRYDEDWSLLADPTCKRESLDDAKYVSLNRADWFLSMGGEIRFKYENYDDPGFGTDPSTPDGYALQRYLLHADWHFGARFRFFSQFQSGLENGRNGGPRLTDKDVADVHQAFLDVKNPGGNITLRVGRQEMEFGAGRLIGESEGLNIRRAFDGVRFIARHGRWTWNSTVMRPLLLRSNTFAIPDHNQTEWGTGVIRSQEYGGIAFYYIGLDRKVAAFNGKAGTEVRETIGTHLWNQGALLDYNTDLIFQTGTFGAGHIVAGAVSSSGGVTLHHLKLQPRIGARFDYASGDSDRASHNLNTFNPLFPNPMYSSLSALLGPANITDLGPTIRLTIDSKTAISPESPFYWRSSLDDGLYGFAGNLIRPATRSSARFVGVQPGVVIDRVIASHLSSTVGYFHFVTGDFLVQTPPGKNVGYLYAAVTSRF